MCVPLSRRSLRRPEQVERGCEGKSDHIEEVTFDAGDPTRRVSLDAVGPGLVERVACSQVRSEFRAGNAGERDSRGFDMGSRHAGVKDGDAGVNVVHATGKGAEHALRFAEMSGFVQDCVIENDGGIGGEDRGFRFGLGDAHGLFKGKAADIGKRVFVPQARFVDVRGLDGVRQGDLKEQIMAARRGGGEDEHAASGYFVEFAENKVRAGQRRIARAPDRTKFSFERASAQTTASDSAGRCTLARESLGTCGVGLQLGLGLCMFGGFFGALQASAQDPALVGKMAANEFAARGQDLHYSYIAEERSTRTGGHLWREKVVETEDGPLHRLLGVDGRALTGAEAKTESDRIASLVRDPAAFREENQAHRGDETHAAQLLGLLPKAFLLTPAGQQDGCVRFTFRPNPAFQASTYEERVVHEMEGTVSLREPMDRLCDLNATISQPVVFGFGLLGRIEKGGAFQLERTPVDVEHWKSNRIVVHMQGRILLLKTLTRDQDVRRTEIHMIPQNLTLAQAAQLTLQ